MKLNTYVAWFCLVPLALVPTTFAVLCAWECTAGPWATIFVAPVAIAVFWVGLTAYLFWATRTPVKSEAASSRGPAMVILLMGLSALTFFLYPFFRK